MERINIYRVEEVGKDYALFGNVRVNFDNDETGTKEQAAGFFRKLIGKPVGIEPPESRSNWNGRYYVAVDFMEQTDATARVIPFSFNVSSIEVLPSH